MSDEYISKFQIGEEGEEVPVRDLGAVRYTELFNLIYPVGSIYMSAALSTPEDVAALFGGIWERWGEGRVPVGVGTADGRTFAPNESGGKKDAIVPSHSHSASFIGNAMGTHNHTQNSHNHTQNSHNHTQNSHNHTQNAHSHTPAISSNNRARSFLLMYSSENFMNESGNALSGGNYYYPKLYADGDGFFRNQSTSSVAATNKATTATNIATTATNIATTATNIAASAGTPSGTVTVTSAGESVTDRNLQPYITCYMYKRTAL